MAESSRRTEILTCAARLFAQRGVAATSVRDIADEVGMLSGSLYHHFPSKDAMVDALLEGYLEDLGKGYKSVLARGSSSPREQFEDMIHLAFDVALQFPDATAVFQRDAGMLSEREHFSYVRAAVREQRKAWIDILTQGIEAGVFRDDIVAAPVRDLVCDTVWSAAQWFVPTPTYPRAMFAKDCASIFLDGYAFETARMKA